MDSDIRSVYSAKISLIWKVARGFPPRLTKRKLLHTQVQKITEGHTEKQKQVTSLSLSIARGYVRKKVRLCSGKEKNKIQNMSLVLKRSIFLFS